MGWQVVYSTRSRKDLQQIVEHIACDDPAAAERFGLRLIDTAESLALAPKMGLLIQDGTDRRYFPQTPYLIIYRVHSRLRQIRVLRFWHGMRERLPLR